MTKELYLVTFNGYRDMWGAEIYLGGIFDSRDKADEYIRSQKDLTKVYPKITVIPVNRGYECKCSEDGFFISTDIFLGGYVE